MFYALTAPDNSVAIMQVVEGADLDECVAKFAAVSFKPVSVRPIDPAVLPADRAYRDAWTFDGERFGHDIAKAREAHRNNLRAQREPMLKAQDVLLMRAIETGADTKAIAVEKQRLRDAPADPRIDAAQTVDELKLITL